MTIELMMRVKIRRGSIRPRRAM